MKALVLCAGRGTRLRPLTYTRSKAALPLAGRPVLAHILQYLHRFGFADVGVVISPGQEELKALMRKCGFGHVDYHNLTGGVVALHVGIKC